MKPPRKILILSANPNDQAWLQTDKEFVSIWQRLQKDQDFAVTTRTDGSLDVMRQLLLDKHPELLHFAGHGKYGSLLLQDENDLTRPLSAEMLIPLLQNIKGLRCVLLNACETEALADALQPYVEYIIAMRGKISDVGALTFSRAFYDALTNQCDYPGAFEIARTALIYDDE